MTKTMLTLTTLAVLAIAAVGVPALAKPGSDGSGSGDHRGPGAQGNRTADHPALNRTERQDARESRHEAMRDAHDQWQDCKREYRDNETLNVSMQQHCMADKDFFLNATHARREAHADIGAIIGLERRLGRLEERKILLQHELNDSSNLTGNQSAELQHRIDKISSEQEKVVAHLEKLRARLKSLDDKWETVREHVAERRHKGLDDGLEDHEDDGSASGSASASDSDSESESDSASDSSSA